MNAKLESAVFEIFKLMHNISLLKLTLHTRVVKGFTEYMTLCRNAKTSHFSAVADATAAFRT